MHSILRAAWFPFVAPTVAWFLLSFLEGAAPRPLYPAAYAFKIALVLAILWACRSAWKRSSFETRHLPLAVGVGILVFLAWVGIEKFVPYPTYGERASFNPFFEISDGTARVLFIGVRLLGLALVVPLVEELFWRFFLPRYLTDENFQSLAPGEFSMKAGAIAAVVFGVAHFEWLAGLVAGAAYVGLMKKTGSLWACVVAHAVTNAALGAYVLMTGDWKLW